MLDRFAFGAQWIAVAKELPFRNGGFGSSF